MTSSVLAIALIGLTITIVLVLLIYTADLHTKLNNGTKEREEFFDKMQEGVLILSNDDKNIKFGQRRAKQLIFANNVALQLLLKTNGASS